MEVNWENERKSREWMKASSYVTFIDTLSIAALLILVHTHSCASYITRNCLMWAQAHSHSKFIPPSGASRITRWAMTGHSKRQNKYQTQMKLKERNQCNTAKGTIGRWHQSIDDTGIHAITEILNQPKWMIEVIQFFNFIFIRIIQ